MYTKSNFLNFKEISTLSSTCFLVDFFRFEGNSLTYTTYGSVYNCPFATGLNILEVRAPWLHFIWWHSQLEIYGKSGCGSGSGCCSGCVGSRNHPWDSNKCRTMTVQSTHHIYSLRLYSKFPEFQGNSNSFLHTFSGRFKRFKRQFPHLYSYAT